MIFVYFNKLLSIPSESAAPQNVRVTGVSRTQVFLEWDDIPCLDRNADIKHYRIFGIHVISGNPTRTGISGRAPYVVNELSQDMEYTFFVYSFYFDDDGIPRGGRNSRMVFATTMGKVVVSYEDHYRLIENMAVLCGY